MEECRKHVKVKEFLTKILRDKGSRCRKNYPLALNGEVRGRYVSYIVINNFSMIVHSWKNVTVDQEGALPLSL